MRRTLVALLTFVALAIPAAAMADDPPDTTDTAPTPLTTPTLPGSVTDEAGAGLFARAFLIAHAGDLVPGARAVQVDIAACRQVDAVQRFYCLATARVVRIQRVFITRYVGRARAHAAGDEPPYSDHRDNRHPRRVRIARFRVQVFACVAVVRIQGGANVTPSATLPVRDCVRINPQGGPAPTPY